PFGDAYEKIGTIQRRLAWPLHKDDTLFQSGRPTGLNIYFVFSFLHLTNLLQSCFIHRRRCSRRVFLCGRELRAFRGSRPGSSECT
ncbi:hypothetical protein BGY98DRAFT_922624, partial [Russula aff. rugulosa BPL654]